MFDKLSENLNLLMARNRVTATKVASQTGIPASTIKKIRNRANTNPTLATLIPLAQFFSVTLEQIIYGNLGEEAVSNQYQSNPHKICTLPIISWAEATNWPQIINHPDNFVVSESNFSANAFVLRVETKDWSLFQKNSFLLIEPNLQPKHGDYIVVHKLSYAEPTLKQLLFEDETTWLRSINIADSAVQLSAMHRILGVLVEHRKQLKTLPSFDGAPEKRIGNITKNNSFMENK